MIKEERRILIKKFILFIAIAVIITVLTAIIAKFADRTYSNEDFNIKRVYSPVDYNENGIDDYSDFLLGAKKDAENKPTYNGAYFEEGYPPDNIGVCTDVVWRAFKEGGYSLRMMVDKDIEKSPQDYPNVETRDSNIDFRRVKNLYVFFKKYAISLTTDINDIAEWQPGDIVIFKDNRHIGIVSDKRNKDGQPYIIHNGGQPIREEDFLSKSEVTSHFRFDASTLPEKMLIPWGEDI